MKISITTNEILIPKKLFAAKVDKELEFDSPLPDFCPDVARIVKVDCTPFMESCKVEGDKITAQGKAVYDVLYETDYKNRLRCCGFTQEFSQTVPLPRSSAENTTAFSQADCSKISCKLLSPRRVMIKSVLGINFEAEGEISVKALNVNEDGETFFRKKTIGLTGKTNSQSEIFRFSEQLALNQGEKCIGEIVCGTITLQSPQVTLYPGRAEIKTTATVHALCEEEENEGKYYMAVKAIPINMEYNNDSIEEFKHAKVSLQPCEAEIAPDLDQYGESRVIKTVFAVKMNLKLNEPKAYTVAEDMFEKGFDSTLVNGTASMPRLFSQTDTSFTVEAKLSPIEPRPEALLDSTARDFGSVAEKAEGGINVSGSFAVTLMANTAEGVYCFDQAVPYNQFVQVELPRGDFSVVADTYPIEIIPTLHSDGTVSLRIIAGVKAYVYTEAEESFVSEVTKRIAREKADKGAMLIYCFPKKDEDLWSIAKLYRVDPEQLKNSNPKAFDENGKASSNDHPVLIKM